MMKVLRSESLWVDLNILRRLDLAQEYMLRIRPTKIRSPVEKVVGVQPLCMFNAPYVTGRLLKWAHFHHETR